jgi:hypothetical protein
MPIVSRPPEKTLSTATAEPVMGEKLVSHYAVPNALLLFPTYFGVFPNFYREFSDFPTTFDTSEAQNKVGIPLGFPLLLLPKLHFTNFCCKLHQLFWFKNFPTTFWLKFFKLLQSTPKAIKVPDIHPPWAQPCYLRHKSENTVPQDDHVLPRLASAITLPVKPTRCWAQFLPLW